MPNQFAASYGGHLVDQGTDLIQLELGVEMGQEEGGVIY